MEIFAVAQTPAPNQAGGGGIAFLKAGLLFTNIAQSKRSEINGALDEQNFF